MTPEQRKAMEMALEAMEYADVCLKKQLTTKTKHEYAQDLLLEAITALRQALEPKCNPHPKAPHGFVRNGSHANDRYTCECEGWDAYEAGRQEGMKQERALWLLAETSKEIGEQK